MAPEPVADVERLYRNRFGPAERAAKALVWKAVVEDFLQRWVGAGEAVLDVGCGFGEFLNHVRCARKVGIDANSESAAHLAPGVEFLLGDPGRMAELADASFGVVFTSNFLEHLRTKAEVEHVVREAMRVLRPGGQLIALGPNLRFLPGEYWDFWDHHTPITDRSLVELCDLVGFRVAEAIPRFLPYTTCSSLPKSPWLVRFYLRLRPVWPLLGRQFLIRAVRP